MVLEAFVAMVAFQANSKNSWDHFCHPSLRQPVHEGWASVVEDYIADERYDNACNNMHMH